MLIRVRFHDDKYNMVKPWILDKLIERQCLKAFLRKEGWVFPGKDRVRGAGGIYQGHERRRKEVPDTLSLAYLLLVKSYEHQLLPARKGKGLINYINRRQDGFPPLENTWIRGMIFALDIIVRIFYYKEAA